MRRSVRSAFVLGVLAGLVLALVRALTRETRPGPAPLAAPVPTLPTGTPPARTPVPVEVVAPPPATAPVTPEPATRQPTTPPPATEPAPETAADAGVWVEPVDGDCPDGFPIKAKVASGIYHRPGGLSYARTKPDRCYPDGPTAEADGFRAAKR
jgi:hypothetical protein